MSNWKKDHARLREKLIKKLDTSSEAVDKRVTRLAGNNHMSPSAALFLIANEKGIRATHEYAKLDEIDKTAILSYQQTKQVNISSSSKHYKPIFNITDSPFDAIQIGERNVFKKQESELTQTLKSLLEQLKTVNGITDFEKADYATDIETLAAEIRKNKPNKSIINSAWNSIRLLKDVGQLGLFINQLTPMIEQLVSQL